MAGGVADDVAAVDVVDEGVVAVGGKSVGTGIDVAV